MNLDIIAQLVQILKDAPELGAIEVHRGLFGRWSAIRVTKAGHMANAGGGAGSGEIKSPMVGTYYAAPEPGGEPYVKVGSRVATGQIVCIIEAMKIMNEIESEVAGVVREVLVENAQPVEFGQLLFRVDPHA